MDGQNNEVSNWKDTFPPISTEIGYITNSAMFFMLTTIAQSQNGCRHSLEHQINYKKFNITHLAPHE